MRESMALLYNTAGTIEQTESDEATLGDVLQQTASGNRCSYLIASQIPPSVPTIWIIHSVMGNNKIDLGIEGHTTQDLRHRRRSRR
jgi:hypothetical protein